MDFGGDRATLLVAPSDPADVVAPLDHGTTMAFTPLSAVGWLHAITGIAKVHSGL